MPRHKKSKKSSFFHKGMTSIKKSTKKVVPGIKSGLETIGSSVIKTTVPVAKNIFSKIGLKTKTRKNKSSKKGKKSKK